MQAETLTGSQLLFIRRLVTIAVDTALELFRDIRKIDKWKTKVGGWFVLMDARTGRILMRHCVGDPNSAPPGKFEKYLRLAEEKAGRLFGHPECVSSWQTRNPELDLWGGAIRVGDLIFSFSGLTELGDEAICLAAASLVADDEAKVLEECSTIMSTSENWPFLPLMERLEMTIDVSEIR